MTEHNYGTCPAKAEIDNLKRWQTDQNGCARRIEDKLDHFIAATLPQKLDDLAHEFREEVTAANKRSTSVTAWLYRTIIVVLLGVIATLAGQALTGG
jgi:hypothetical protein